MQGRDGFIGINVFVGSRRIVGVHRLETGGGTTSSTRWLLSTAFSAFFSQLLERFGFLQITLVFVYVYKLFAARALHVFAPMMLNFFHAVQQFQTGRTFLASDAHRGTGWGNRFAADAFHSMGIQTRLTVKETVTLLVFQGSRAVMLVGIDVVLATVLEAGSTKLGLVVGAGVLSQSIVGFQAVRAEITFPE